MPQLEKQSEDKHVESKLIPRLDESSILSSSTTICILLITNLLEKNKCLHKSEIDKNRHLCAHAECKARLHKVPDAIATLNELRAQRNLSPLPANPYDESSIIDEILLERRRELWGEGRDNQ